VMVVDFQLDILRGVIIKIDLLEMLVMRNMMNLMMEVLVL
jgi:hypothetical protein